MSLLYAQRRRALAEGRDAAIAERLLGQPVPANPYRKGTKRHGDWNWGQRQAIQLCEALKAVGK